MPHRSKSPAEDAGHPGLAAHIQAPIAKAEMKKAFDAKAQAHPPLPKGHGPTGVAVKPLRIPSKGRGG